MCLKYISFLFFLVVCVYFRDWTFYLCPVLQYVCVCDSFSMSTFFFKSKQLYTAVPILLIFRYYNHYKEGEYVFYRHTTLPYEVSLQGDLFGLHEKWWVHVMMRIPSTCLWQKLAHNPFLRDCNWYLWNFAWWTPPLGFTT